MLRRQLAAIGGNIASDLPLDALAAAGWDLHVIADDMEGENENLDLPVRFHVGVVRVEPREARLRQLEELMMRHRSTEWIALVEPHALESKRARAFVAEAFFDYHTLPADAGRLCVSLGHAYGKANLRLPLGDARQAQGEFDMVGVSPAMEEVYRSIRKMHNVDASVMIGGESGTGKELAARAIHISSRRADRPFVPVNCAALPSHLIQSELFGHEKGAFTGAVARKIGRIEAAAGGTVFLDEIGDLPLGLQVNLLRFLQERTIERLGSHTRIPVDVRVIAASHVNLERAVEQGRFRGDLFYRINVLHLYMPPLRERGGDIALLAHTYFDKFSREIECRAKGFSAQAMDVMLAYPWPGNVRELINRVRRAVVMGEGRLIMPADLELEQRTVPRTIMTLDEARARAERDSVRQALHSNRNNVSKAARQLGISRATLYRLLGKQVVHTPS